MYCWNNSEMDWAQSVLFAISIFWPVPILKLPRKYCVSWIVGKTLLLVNAANDEPALYRLTQFLFKGNYAQFEGLSATHIYLDGLRLPEDIRYSGEVRK